MMPGPIVQSASIEHRRMYRPWGYYQDVDLAARYPSYLDAHDDWRGSWAALASSHLKSLSSMLLRAFPYPASETQRGALTRCQPTAASNSLRRGTIERTKHVFGATVSGASTPSITSHPGDYATFNSNQPCDGLVRGDDFQKSIWAFDPYGGFNAATGAHRG